MSLERLRAFLEVYRRRSMSQAAAALSLTQPAVSKQIAALESELGAPLFIRSRGGAAPTPAAHGLAREISAPLDQLNEALAARKARSGSLTGVVRLGAPTEMFAAFGGRILGAFAGRALRVEAHLGGGEFLRAGLAAGTFDLAFLASPPPDRVFGQARIGAERLRLVAHPALRDALRGRAIDAQALSAQPFVAYDADLSLIRQYFEQAFGAPCAGAPLATVPDLRAVLGVVSAIPSWTVSPDYLAAPGLASGALVPLGAASEPVNPHHLVWRKTALRAARIAFAKAAILEAFSGAA